VQGTVVSITFLVNYSVAQATRGQHQIKLLLFGIPELRLAGKNLELLTKKLLALTAYLALEGSATSAELAALLWNVTDDRARASLRGELYRLRDSSFMGILVANVPRTDLTPQATKSLPLPPKTPQATQLSRASR
jgi:hypothetical protein